MDDQTKREGENTVETAKKQMVEDAPAGEALEERTETKEPRKKTAWDSIISFADRWFSENIFNFRWDAICYFILYCVLPIFITALDLERITLGGGESHEVAYWYAGILIAVANCLYDSYCRDHPPTDIWLTKICIVRVVNWLIAGYCTWGMLSALIVPGSNGGIDWILCIYAVVFFIALFDLIALVCQRYESGQLAGELAREYN